MTKLCRFATSSRNSGEPSIPSQSIRAASSRVPSGLMVSAMRYASFAVDPRTRRTVGAAALVAKSSIDERRERRDERSLTSARRCPLVAALALALLGAGMLGAGRNLDWFLRLGFGPLGA